MKTIQEALQNFLIASEADGLKDTSLKWYRSILHRMAESLGVERTIDSITTQELREFIVSLKTKNRYEGAPQRKEEDGSLSGDTIAGHVTAYHRFWKWSAEEYEINNPMARIKRHKRPTPMPKAIEYEDFIKLYQATSDDLAGARDKATLAVFADSGGRLDEITSMLVSHVTSGQMRAYIKGKGDKHRWIYWTEYVQMVLEHYLILRNHPSENLWINLNTGNKLTTGGMYQIMKRLKKKAGVTGRSNPHAFRHNFAKEFVENGGSLPVLQRAMGHNTPISTQGYLIYSGNELQSIHKEYSVIRHWKNLHQTKPENF